ncbi:MAG TPA: methyltransferase domain-containing protein [Usitatibacter sp.]|nr:methyltransferase domain-containing protein [Usitatibacter sp.]
MSASLPDAETSRWYEDKVRRYGFDHRGLGFRNRSSQEKRFDALITLGDFHGRRLLDVGCGFGDLLAYLHERGIRPIYTGLDICEPMVRRCTERFPASNARFVTGDVLQHEPDQPYDFVVASGIFGLDAAGTRERIRPTVERMFSWARIGMAANFLSLRTPRPAEARVYVEPTEILGLGLALTSAARLDHTYLPNDFTLFLYKTPAWVADRSAS